MAILGRLWLFWADYDNFGLIMAILAISSVPRRETTKVHEVSIVYTMWDTGNKLWYVG